MINKKNKAILISMMGFYQGGAEIMPIRIANELQREGYRVGVHCLKKNDDAQIRAFLNDGIPVYYTDRTSVFAALLLAKRYAVVHTHCVASQQLVARMKRRFPFIAVRHVATSHGGYEGLEELQALSVIREVDAATDIWTYVADNNRETFDKAAIPEHKMMKIGNAIEKHGEIDAVRLSQYGVPEDAVVFTVITRAVWKKCWRECIETIREARSLTGKNIHLILGGTGPVYEELMQEPLEEFIHLIGVVSDPCGVYRASYCGLLLSVRECAPLGIIEMYHAGIPVIATDTGDIVEMVTTEKGMAGTVVDLNTQGQIDIHKAAAAVARMVLDKAYYNQCRQQAMAKACEFRMDKITGKYLESYGF